jgi:ArsR family transcriptional regulator
MTVDLELFPMLVPPFEDSERRGLWAYYYVRPQALKELSTWLS